MSSSTTAQPRVDSAQRAALGCGAVGVIVAVILGALEARGSEGGPGWQTFFQAYIFAYVYCVVFPLGCLAILMVHHLTGGWWGYPIRRILEAGSRTIRFMALLFIPILLGMSRIYIWARPADVAADPLLEYKKPYLNPAFFTVRTVIYFAIWMTLAHFLNKWSREQDQTADPRLKLRMAALAGPGLVLWALTVSGAAIDWVMSLEPHWFSTIYGMLFMVIGLLAAMAFSIVMLRALSEREPLRDCVEPKRYIDLGNLMLAFTMLWTYMSFSQFLIIWAGNLKDEIPWYMVRAFGKWAYVAVILLLFHFFFPFFLLLQRRIKKRLRTLALVAGWLVVLTLVDVFWLVVPAYEPSGPLFAPMVLDLFAVVGIGGLWLAAFLVQLKKLPLLPLHDPRFEPVLEHSHGD
jgi:hypothetical protein